ncbi:HNH endonuclease signature motif containing protein [Rahnella sp. Larv3_ips]|uniref:HNH endonuclease n=1 Tax=Rahnella sp. Larv3_ips TaxID=1896943 RepID=UPI000EFC974C|nr:HNH endonuclease signature motif containing protein [Rahnella sp. Larv3_ips]
MNLTYSHLSSRTSVMKAIEECDSLGREVFLKSYGFRYSRKYFLVHNDERYDTKAIVAAAFYHQFGVKLKPTDFSGGVQTVVPLLTSLGFKVIKTPHPVEFLKKGMIYQRKELLSLYGGQLQAGIWTPKEFSVIFIFSGDSGSLYGYKDDWTSDGLFSYTGEGQSGNMVFSKGNKAIRDHKENGRDIFLFEDRKKEAGVRFSGMFECDTWAEKQCKDIKGKDRIGIIFNLTPVDYFQDVEINLVNETHTGSPSSSLSELRKKALKAALTTGSKQTSDTKASWFKRSEDVRRYVLKRANGICECCDKEAPFKKRNGEPYLEPHHTKRLADEGPDHPKWVGAICPTCHRHIHSGENGDCINKKLMEKLLIIETD